MQLRNGPLDTDLRRTGVIERANGELMRHLTILINECNIKNSWSEALPMVQRIINSTIQSSIGPAPVLLLFGDRLNLQRELVMTPSPYSFSIIYPEDAADAAGLISI